MKPVKGLENYHLLEQIGEGSFGKVYRGRRKNTGMTVAIKTISKHGKTQRDLTAIWQEIVILADLRHENIIRWIDAIDTPENFIVITEFAQGELYEILTHDKCLPEDVVQNIARQLVRALYYLHSNRILHRDMKPQNILISSNGVVKLCDFGFARCMSSATVVLTSIKGTPLYMAPELVQERPYNHTVDLWSLGIILFELYVGKPPFYTKSLLTLINRIVGNPVVYPETMSPAFKSFLQGLLCKQPGQRLSWPKLLEHEFIREAPLEAPIMSIAGDVHSTTSAAHQGTPMNSEPASTQSRTPSVTSIPGHLQIPASGGTLVATPSIAAEQICSHPLDTRSKPTRMVPRSVPPPQQEQRMQLPLLPSSSAPSPPLHRSPLVETQAPSPDSHRQPQGFMKADAIQMGPSSRGHLTSGKVNNGIGSSSVTAALQKAEASAPGSAAGAQQLWSDGRTVAALYCALKPPADKLTHLAWANSLNMCSAVKVTLDLLRQSGGQPGSVPLQQALASALLAASTVAPANVSSALDMLRLTDSMASCRSGGAVALEGSAQLYTALVGRGQRRGPEAWRVATAAADGLGALTGRAQHFLADSRSSATQKVDAEAALHGPYLHDAAAGLVFCVAAAAGISSAASCAAVGALASAVHTAAGGSCTSSIADHFPLIAALGSCATPKGLHPAMLATRIATGSALAECSGALPALKAHLTPSRTTASPAADIQRPGDAVIVLLAACSHSPECCKAAANANLPQALVEAAGGRHGVEAMLALAAIARGVQGPPGADPVARLFSTAEGLATAIRTLLPIMQAPRDDGAAASAAAGALGGIIVTNHRRWGANTAAPSPLADLFSAITMASLRVLLAPRIGKSPMFAAFEGVGCISGAADGPLAMTAALVAVGGPAAPAALAVVRANVANMAVDLLAGAAEMPPPAVLAEVSPAGLLSLLSLAATLAAPDGQGPLLLVRDQVLPGVVAVASPPHLQALQHWPAPGGVVDGPEIAAIAAAVTRLLAAPFLPCPAMPEADTGNYTRKLVAQPAIAALTRLVPLVGVDAMVLSLSLILRLLHSEKTLARQFAAQYISGGGLAPGLVDRLVGPPPQPQKVVIVALQIMSQLAKLDPCNYADLDKACVCSRLLPLMGSRQAGVRSGAANLMGNLARHSSFFYSSFHTAGLLPPLVELCGDPHSEACKSGCIAIGNAAFHSSELYGDLAAAVTPLVAILSGDGDLKTRNNAAGALGNLVRKSDRLAPTLLAAGALQALLRVLSQPGADTSGQACKIALFSLSNLAQWQACSSALKKSGAGPLLQHVVQTTRDASTRDFARKMQDRLGMIMCAND